MKPKKKDELKLSFTDEQVKEQVNIVLGLGRRTIEDSFKLGEMLVSKKAEKEHGDWLPYLEEIGLKDRFAQRLITAFNKKDTFITGMTYSQLSGITNTSNSRISKDKQPDWFDQHTGSAIEAFTLKTIIKAQKKIEKDFGIVYLNEFREIITQVLEQGITHINYKELWKQG